MATDDILLPDEDSQLRAVEQLLADDAPHACRTATASATATATDATGPNPMVMVAKAMLEAQGPVPSYADFAAAIPSGNPFSAAAAPSEAQSR